MLEKTRSRSRIKRSKQKTVDEKKWLDKVGGLPCCVCGKQPVELHHIRTNKGMSVRASHYEVLPLCTGCHRGDLGLHGLGRKAFEKKYGITELELLEKVRTALNG